MAQVVAEAPGCPPEWCARIARWAGANYEIRAVYIFGSRATGDHDLDSDLDVGLIFFGDDGPALAYWCDEAEELQRQVAALVDVEVDLQPAFDDDRIVMPALREHGVCIYAAPGFSGLF